MGVLSQDIGCEIVMLILAVEKDQVGECFCREGRVLKQEVELFESSGRILLNIHKRGVVKGDWIELILITWGHIHEGFPGGSRVLHRVLDGCFEVEGFDEGGLFEGLRVADTLNFNTF